MKKRYGEVGSKILRGKLGVDNFFIAFGLLGMFGIPLYFYFKFRDRKRKYTEVDKLLAKHGKGLEGVEDEFALGLEMFPVGIPLQPFLQLSAGPDKSHVLVEALFLRMQDIV